MTAKPSPLPANLPPRGLSRTEAAAYVGISPGLFDELVRGAVMPSPIRLKARVLWDRVKLDEAFARLSNDQEAENPWDKG